MKKKLLQSLLFFLAFFYSNLQKTNAQCTNTTLYPSTTATIAHSTTLTQVTSAQYAGEYNNQTLTAAATGDVYVFTSSIATDYITLRDGTGAIVLASGVTPLTYTQPAVPYTSVQMHTNTNAACGTQSSSRTTSAGLGTTYSYSSSTTTQPLTTTVTQGATNVQALRVDVVVAGNYGSAATLTNLDLGLGTTTLAGDIATAKVYYTGTSTTFASTTQFGSSVSSPGATFSITGSQTLSSGTNYFWLVYDLTCVATATDVLDGACTSLTVGANYAPATTNPAGTRAITALYAPTYTTSTAGNYTQGTTNAQKAYINISGSSLCPANATSVTFNTGSSTAPAADILQAKCYYTTTSTFATTTPFGSAVPTPNGAITFTGTQALANGTGNYFWLVYDISCTATALDSINATITNIVVGGNTYIPTGTSYSKHAVSILYAPTRTDGNSTTAVNPGTVNNTFAYGVINGSTLCPGTATQVDFTVSGTAPATDISYARCFYTTTSTFAATTPFGTAIANPASGTISFTGSQALANGANYFWLVYDLSCSAVAANTLNGDINSITVGSSYPVTGTATAANAVSAVAATYTTIADGAWNSGATWNCGVVPPTNVTAVTINNNITVNTAGNIAGSVTIAAGKTLTIAAGGDLTMGTSSAGAATGNSNRVLTTNGTLTITGGTLNLNGSYVLASAGNFNMSGGTFNIDPNDGTAGGSATGITFSIASITAASQMNVTGGAINLLDPPYASASRAIAYSTSALDMAWGTGCTVTLGGGDDQNAANTSGFYVECNVSTGTLEIGTLVVNGGRYSAQRHASTYTSSSYITKARNLTINAGSELVTNSAILAITGNLVNNGFITTTSTTLGAGPAFVGDAQYISGVTIFPSTTAQSISGTGYFKKSTGDPDPTAQTGNVLGGLMVWHTAPSPGLTLNMPITSNGYIRLLGGKVNTTSSNFLALGCGATLPGTTASLTATSGTLYGSSGTAPTTIATYLPGGWVNGTFNRYVPASTTFGQQGLMPLGSDTARPVLILFTAAPTAGGYLNGTWFDANGGTNGLPLTEAAVTPNSISLVSGGYWQIAKDAALTGGTYDATFNNTLQAGAGLIDYTNTTLIKRANAGSNWAIEGTHVATTGSNSAPTAKRTGLTSFSEFAIAGGNGVVPVKIEYFRGTKQGTNNLIDWKVSCTNTPSATLTLERSADARSFSNVYSINATALRCLQPFSYTDAATLPGMNYYRLKMKDASGTVTYSSIVALLNRDKGFEIVSITPNPVTDGTFKLNITTAEQTKMEVVITDVQGRVMSKQSLTLIAGFNAIDMNVSNFAKGTYQLFGNTADGKTKTLGFVKQ